MAGQNTSSAVMAQRHVSRDEFDYYPTPPWGTRALCEKIKCPEMKSWTVFEPACGEGFMARPLSEYFGTVVATDIQDFSATFPEQDAVFDFLLPFSPVKDVLPDGADWIITNPPFVLGLEFVLRALDLARRGVAILVRVQFLEGIERYEELYAKRPPAIVYFFSGRLPINKGRCSKKAGTATAYCWLVWDCENLNLEDEALGPRIKFIRGGSRARLERDDDYPAWGQEVASAPLFDGLPS